MSQDFILRNKDVMRTLFEFLKTHHRYVEKQVTQTGLHHAQHKLLMNLAKETVGSQAELAKQLSVSPATIAVSLKNLEKDGYIIREMNQKDNRFNHILLTEKGKCVVDESKHIFESIDSMIFENISEQEKETLVEIVSKMTNALKE